MSGRNLGDSWAYGPPQKQHRTTVPGRKKFYVRLIAAMTVFFVTLAMAGISLADNLVYDGDGLAPLVAANGTVAFGDICKTASPSPQKNVLFAINKVGGGNVYANSATVEVSTTGTSSTALSATDAGDISLPANWTTLGNNTLSTSQVTSTITLNPSSLPVAAFSGTVSYSAAGDKNGGGTNTRSATVNVTANIISCNTAPTLNLPANITAEATNGSGAVVTYSVTAPDAEDNPDPTPTCSPVSGSTFALGITTVNCSVTDSGSLTTNGSFTITVQDTAAPILSLANQTLEATGPLGVVATFSPSASDIVDGSVVVTCDANSGDTFPLGTTTVNCSAEDDAGNSVSGSFTITVQDITPPALTLPADIGGVEATGPGGAAVNFSASALDIVDGSVAVTCNWNPGDTFPLGTTIVNCSATDAHLNTASGSFTVTVVDTTAPVIAAHADVTEEATSALGAIVNYTSPATSDTVDGAGTATCTPASGSQFALGDTTVTCNAEDVAGNDADATTFVIHVVDTTAPVIAAHADITVNATSSSGAVVTYTSPTTSDAVDGGGVATCSPASGGTFPIGNTTVYCDAEDAAGNDAVQTSFVVHVVYDWTGFFRPVDNKDANGNYVFNVVKAGQAIPMKFNLGGNQGLNIFNAGYPKSARVPCDATSPTDLIEETVTAGNSSLTYDSSANQYIYVWKTDKLYAGQCRVFDLGLNDGTTHLAYFKFTR